MLKRFLALLLLVMGSTAMAQSARGFDDSAANLMVVLRESPGANKQLESLVPVGKVKIRLPDGREVELDTAWFEYLGDMHVRFVFDTPTSMPSAAPSDLQRLGLSPEAALELAVRNIRRVYGEPVVTPWEDVFQVQGKSADLDSSYFLHKDFWNQQLKLHPQGLVALVAKRGGLLFSPLANTKAVAGMRRGVGYLHASSENLRISSALYLFKDGKWTVFQAPVASPR